MDNIKSILSDIREELDGQYPEGLSGRCIEASDLILAKFKQLGISGAKSVEGWCKYDDDSGCSSRDYDEHTWVEYQGRILDITLDQFQPFIDESIPKVYIGPMPYYLSYGEPL